MANSVEETRAYVTDGHIDVKTIQEIIDRGNTAEVKRNKHGIVILEVRRSIARRDNVSPN